MCSSEAVKQRVIGAGGEALALVPEPTLSPRPDNPCFCKITGACFFVYRFFGIFPFTWRHQDGGCEFTVSRPWTAYTAVMIVLLFYANKGIVHLSFESLVGALEWIDKLMHVISCFLLLAVAGFVVKPTEVYLKYLIVAVNKLICTVGRKHMRWVEMCLMASLLSMLCLLATASLYFDQLDVVTRGNIWLLHFHMVPYMFIGCYTTMYFLELSIYMCYHGALVNVLEYEVQHPNAALDVKYRNNTWLLGLLPVCECDVREHAEELAPAVANLTPVYLIEFLRLRQEEICKGFRDSNDLIYFPFEVFLVTEIFFIFLQYLFITNLYFSGDYQRHVLLFLYTCFYVFYKQIVLVLVLYGSSLITYQSDAIKHILMEYTYEDSSDLLDQQIRIFLHKLEFSPTSVHCLGLSHIGLGGVLPIFEFIMTHVVVEIQFFQVK